MLLTFVSSILFVFHKLSISLPCTTACLTVDLFMLIVAWKYKSTRLIASLYVCTSLANIYVTSLCRENAYMFICVGILFDLLMMHCILHYQKIAGFLLYKIDEPVTLFQVFALANIYKVSVYYNTIVLASFLATYFTNITLIQDVIYTHLFSYVKLGLTLLIYVNMLALIIDCDSLHKISKA